MKLKEKKINHKRLEQETFTDISDRSGVKSAIKAKQMTEMQLTQTQCAPCLSNSTNVMINDKLTQHIIINNIIIYGYVKLSPAKKPNMQIICGQFTGVNRCTIEM